MNSSDGDNISARKDRETRLASLYEEYYDRIARYVYVRIGNRDEAQDIAGKVFLKALESLKSYQERGIPMQAWLFRIAHNLVIDYYRKMHDQRTVPIDSVTVRDDADPAAIVEKNIELERVNRAMEQLTAEQKEVIGLRFFAGLTSKEVGSILNKSDGAVREMQRAGIEKLRSLLGVQC